MLPRVFFLLIVLLRVVKTPLHAALVPDDKDYRVWRSVDGSYEHVIPKELDHYLSELDDWTQKIIQHYQKSFGHKLDERASLIWASENNQITNAYATQYPLQHTVYYRGSPPAYDSFAIISWWKTLLIHEMAHLYQLNPKEGLSKIGHSIFGNNIISFLPIPIPTTTGISAIPIPAATTPTMFLPTWVMEGNAVLNESLLDNGGRLFSAETYALIYRMLQLKKIDETRMTNNVLDFPFGTEKYLLGGMINLYMARKWGVDKVNQFFVAQATHYFNPFRVTVTFEKHFGMSYRDLIYEALQFFHQAAQWQKNENVTVLATGLGKYFLTRSIEKNMINALVQDRMHELPSLLTLSAENGSLTTRTRGAWPLGRPFHVEGQTVSTASALVDRRYVKFSLWSKEEVRLKDFDDYWVMDVKHNLTLAAHVPSSFNELMLYVLTGSEKKKIGAVNSSALFANDNQAIYFIQKGKTRRLMKGQKELFQYQGYWGYPVDSVGDDIYFVAPTQYGAGLFRWRSGAIVRLGISDTVLSARLLQDGRWLLVQIGEDGYELGITQERLVERSESPYEILLFPSALASTSPESIAPYVEQQVAEKNAALEKNSSGMSEFAYNPLARIRFSAWNLMYSNNEKGSLVSTQASFADPALYNQLELAALVDKQDEENSFQLSYLNSYHLLNWGVIGVYEQYDPQSSYLARYKNESWGGGPFLAYHFWRYKQWNLLGNTGVVRRKSHHHAWNEGYFDLTLGRNRPGFIAMYPASFLEFSLQSTYLQDGMERGAFWRSSTHLDAELFWDLDLSFTQSSTFEFNPGQRRGDLHQIPFERVSFFVEDAHAWRFGNGFKQVIDLGWYHRWIPLGLNRIAPIIFANYWSYERIRPSDAFEYGLGLDMDLLLGHLASSKIQISILNRRHIREETVINLQLNGAF